MNWLPSPNRAPKPSRAGRISRRSRPPPGPTTTPKRQQHDPDPRRRSQLRRHFPNWRQTSARKPSPGLAFLREQGVAAISIPARGGCTEHRPGRAPEARQGLGNEARAVDPGSKNRLLVPSRPRAHPDPCPSKVDDNVQARGALGIDRCAPRIPERWSGPGSAWA